MDSKKLRIEDSVIAKVRGIVAEIHGAYPEMNRMTIAFNCEGDYWISARATKGNEPIIDASFTSRGQS